jgi:hypothetical protein
MAKPRTPLVLGGRVVDGHVHLDSPKFYRVALPKWEGLRVRVTVEQEAETRRQQANRFYWGVVLKLMAEESGHTADELHELGKLRHNSKVVVDPFTGEETKIAQSTAKLSVADFGVYLERVMLDGAEWLGITFPEPRKDEDWRTEKAAA